MKRLFLISSFLMVTLFAHAVASVTLAWNASTDPIVVGYNIYYGSVTGVYTNEVNCGNATNFTISGLVSGVTYHFVATTYSSGGLESPFSSECVYTVPNPVPPPAAPTNLRKALATIVRRFAIVHG